MEVMMTMQKMMAAYFSPMLRRLSLLLGLLLATQMASAEVYQWKDASGQVHYGNQPGSRDATKVNVAPTPKQNPELQQRAKTLQERQTQRKEQRDMDAVQKKNAQLEKTHKEQVDAACKKYYENMAMLKETGQRVYLVGPDGETQYLSDEERAAKIASTQKLIDQHCN